MSVVEQKLSDLNILASERLVWISLGASPFTRGRKGLVHFASATCSSHPTGTVGRQLSVKASNCDKHLRKCVHSIGIPITIIRVQLARSNGKENRIVFVLSHGFVY